MYICTICVHSVISSWTCSLISYQSYWMVSCYKYRNASKSLTHCAHFFSILRGVESVVGLYNRAVVGFLKSSHCLSNGCATLHSHQQCVSIHFFSHPCLHLFIFWISDDNCCDSGNVVHHCSFNFHSDAQWPGLFSSCCICWPFLICRLMYFAHWLTRLFVLLLSFLSSLSIMGANPLWIT